MLFAIFLRTLSTWLSRHTPLSTSWALACVVALLVSSIALGVWLRAPRIAAEVEHLVLVLPEAVRELERRGAQYTWGQYLLQEVNVFTGWMPRGDSPLARATGIFSTTLSVLTNVVIILIVGLYLAVDPHPYTRGLVRLVPLGHRPRAHEVLSALGTTLWWWLVDRLFSMTVIGVLSTVALWWLGVPLALTLGILAALLTFIPTIGPVLAMVPPALLAFSQSPRQALYVILVYLGIQAVETYLITPLVQQRAVSLPPVLTIAGLLVGSVLFGFLGLLLAAPLVAVTLVLVRMLYIEDVLGDTEARQQPVDQD